MKIYANDRYDKELDRFIDKPFWVKCGAWNFDSGTWEPVYVNIKEKTPDGYYRIATEIRYLYIEFDDDYDIPTYTLDELVSGKLHYKKLSLCKPLEVYTIEEFAEFIPEPWRSKYLENEGIL